MNRKFVYQEQGDEALHEITGEQILEHYFPYWSAEMIRAGKQDQISNDACIDDWVVTNWAEEITNA